MRVSALRKRPADPGVLAQGPGGWAACPSGGRRDESGLSPPNGEKLAKADSPHPVGGGSKKPTCRSPVLSKIGRRARNSNPPQARRQADRVRRGEGARDRPYAVLRMVRDHHYERRAGDCHRRIVRIRTSEKPAAFGLPVQLRLRGYRCRSSAPDLQHRCSGPHRGGGSVALALRGVERRSRCQDCASARHLGAGA